MGVIVYIKVYLVAYGEPDEEPQADEEVAEGQVHDGPLRVVIS